MTTPPAVAVIVTGVDAAVVVVTAVNVTRWLFWATVTDAGMAINDVFPFPSATGNAPESVFEVSVTVHVLGWLPITEAGEQDTADNVTVG